MSERRDTAEDDRGIDRSLITSDAPGPSRRPRRDSALSRWILGPPGLQRVRAAQSLLAVAVFLVFTGVQAFEVSHGLIDLWASNALSIFNLVGSLLFFIAIRTGFNRRFESDPSLTYGQCLFGMVSVNLSYAITGPARGAVMGIMLLILVFAMFALPLKRIRALAIFGFGMLIAIMVWRTRTLPDRYPLVVEVTHLMFALIIVASIAVLSVRMGRLRQRLQRQKAELQEALEQNRRLATLDDLTGLFNRRHMSETLQAEQKRQKRGALSMSLALIDIDLFKHVNDQHGHAAGDAVLKRFASLAVTVLREADSVSRWGGEEFLVMMPMTDTTAAVRAIERLRIAFEGVAWPDIDPQLVCTFSAGIATLASMETMDSAIERADQCMYAAKSAGRNRVSIEPLVAG